MLCCKCFCFPVKEDFESTVKPSSEGHSGVLTVTAIVAAVITVIVVVAAPIGLFICRGKILQRFAQQPQSCLEGQFWNYFENHLFIFPVLQLCSVLMSDNIFTHTLLHQTHVLFVTTRLSITSQWTVSSASFVYCLYSWPELLFYLLYWLNDLPFSHSSGDARKSFIRTIPAEIPF